MYVFIWTFLKKGEQMHRQKPVLSRLEWNKTLQNIVDIKL